MITRLFWIVWCETARQLTKLVNAMVGFAAAHSE